MIIIKEEEFLNLEKEVKNLVNIYLPKLESLYNSGNGSYIVHKAGNQICILNQYMKKYSKKDIDEKIRILLRCKAIIEENVLWMLEKEEHLYQNYYTTKT